MNSYPIVKQEKESWSLPACLQSIIKLRRFHAPSQNETAEILGVKDCNGDLVERLTEFLESYDLGLRYENPFTNKRGYDLLLESEINDKTDVLVAYDYNAANEINGKERR